MLTPGRPPSGAKRSHTENLGRFGRRIDRFVESRLSPGADAARLRLDALNAFRASLVAPGSTPVRGWIPLGPFVVRLGEGATRPATSGRVAGIAVSKDGQRIYAASHNGGVWRSDDTGRTWSALMNASAQGAPAAPASDSLACGAIAIDPTNPDIIYVGTGEGYAAVLIIQSEIGKWIGYFGVGAVVSTRGGATFTTEAVAEGDPPLVGSGFFQLAVDPATPGRVLAATVQGLYRREVNPKAPAEFHWAYVAAIGQTEFNIGSVTSVVAATSGDATVFFVARADGHVFRSSDAATWTPMATIPPKPTAGLAGFALEDDVGGGRVSLAVPATDPPVLYALTHNERVLRLDLTRPDAQWENLDGVPAGFMNGPDIPLFGYYAQAIAVAPGDPNTVYIGGASVGETHSGAVYRCKVSPAAASLEATFIGNSLHADIHALVFTPGDPNQLWVGTDGGVFYSSSPAGAGDIFASRNLGLSTISCNAVAQHPQNDAILLCGTQDNGCLRFSGDEVWVPVAPGDGGATVIKRTDPNQIVSGYVDAKLRRSVDGGASFTDVSVPVVADNENVLFYPPLVGNPPDQTDPAQADLLAFGSERPWISTDFGLTWQSIPANDLEKDRLDDEIRALCFASPTKLYAGTRAGSVYRFVQANGAWTQQPLPPPVKPPDPNQPPPPVPTAPGEITSIAVDPHDPSGDSIYVTLGGSAADAHLMRFDGQRPAGGPASPWDRRDGGLPPMQLNALAVDTHFDAMFVGADVGVWRSTDGGQHWENFSRDLPEAPVLDLQFHPDPSKALLRAATYGRGVYEYYLGGQPLLQPELYIRRTALDRGVYPVPAAGPGTSPDISVFVLAENVDFLQFANRSIAETDSIPSQSASMSHVYVQVHNRANAPVSDVYVALLASRFQDHVPPLPLADGAGAALAGQAFRVDGWTTVGVQTLSGVAVNSPGIASFALSADIVGAPGGWLCLTALVHHMNDPLEASTDAASLATSSRKMASRVFSVI